MKMPPLQGFTKIILLLTLCLLLAGCSQEITGLEATERICANLVRYEHVAHKSQCIITRDPLSRQYVDAVFPPGTTSREYVDDATEGFEIVHSTDSLVGIVVTVGPLGMSRAEFRFFFDEAGQLRESSIHD